MIRASYETPLALTYVALLAMGFFTAVTSAAFGPASGTWSFMGGLNTPRAGHTASAKLYNPRPVRGLRRAAWPQPASITARPYLATGTSWLLEATTQPAIVRVMPASSSTQAPTPGPKSQVNAVRISALVHWCC